MRILYYHQHFTTPAFAGATRSYEFSQKLIAKGHSVTMVCGEISRFDLKETNKKGIKRGYIDGIDVIQISLPYSNNDSIFTRMVLFLKFALKGIKIAFDEEYDLLFATSTPLTAGIPGVFIKFFKKKKFVFEVRDLWPELPKALGMKNPLLIGGMSFIEWVSYKKADGCIGLSPGICDGIKRRLKTQKRIELIPNGCDTELFKPGNRKELVLKGVNDGDTVAIFTGTHGVANGLDSIINAALHLKEKGRNDIKLVFIGNGKEKPALVKKAFKFGLDNCLFFDPIPKNELNLLVARCDVGLMVLANVPAFYYGTSPNKFFDYISSALPVLINYPGWLAEIIKENKCGIVVEPDNPEDFANGLLYLADNPEIREVLKKNSRKLAEKEFDRDILGNKFVSFLEEIYNS